jgi:phenylpyruvate tautomerase PptA (4-oxalocrotonate tautomerase family)
MPHIRIEMIKGKSKEYKKAVLDGVHKSLMDILMIPDHDRYQRIYEFDKEDFEVRPGKTDQFLVINILMFQGRSTESKKKLYQAIVNHLEENPGIKADDITVILQDIPMENWGFGGKPGNEMDFGFKIDV